MRQGHGRILDFRVSHFFWNACTAFTITVTLFFCPQPSTVTKRSCFVNPFFCACRKWVQWKLHVNCQAVDSYIALLFTVFRSTRSLRLAGAEHSPFLSVSQRFDLTRLHDDFQFIFVVRYCVCFVVVAVVCWTKWVPTLVVRTSNLCIARLILINLTISFHCVDQFPNARCRKNPKSVCTRSGTITVNAMTRIQLWFTAKL